MAVRSGAGTGVVVSLVVFILTTFFLLVLTIVFYSGQSKAEVAQADAEQRLSVYVKPAQRNSDVFKQFEDAARANNLSVSEFLNGRIQNVTQFVDGSKSADIQQIQENFRRLGVGDGQSVRDAFRDSVRTVTDRQNEIDRLNTQLEAQQQQAAELRTTIDGLNQARSDLDQQIEAQLGVYRDSVTAYREELDQTVSQLDQQVDRLDQENQSEVRMLQNEIDQLSQERVILISRIDDLEAKVRQERLKATSPDLLVDGRVIDSANANDQVFIDIGRRNHVVQGMNFEVFDDTAALHQVDQVTGALPRGKASLEVIKVGETTSTCKIVRPVPGRPVVRGDVIANAVYDPNYTFKFLVHGKFDVNRDGTPTELEADYIRSLIEKWGGAVIRSDDLPGDLDFLILGAEPPMPPPLRADPSPHETKIWLDKRTAHDSYNKLKRHAMDAQIPVLNANRFFILTGYTAR